MDRDFRHRGAAGAGRGHDLGRSMTADELLIELRVLIETTCYPPWGPSGRQPPITNDQWDTITDRVMLLAAKNKIREAGK